MIARASLLRLASLIAVAACCGCVSKPDTPPVLSLEGRECGAQPELGHAQRLEFGEEKEATVTFDAQTPCIAGPVGRTTYTVVELPQIADEYLLQVTSAPIGQGILFPRLTIMDSEGHPTRDISPTSFINHGATLYVGLRIHSGERYLVVASDPSSIGQQSSYLALATSSQPIVAGPLIFHTYSGAESTTTRTYSHNGKIIIAARKLPNAK